MIPGKLEFLLGKWGPLGDQRRNMGQSGVMVFVHWCYSLEGWVYGLNMEDHSMLWLGVVVYALQWIGCVPFHWQCCLV